MDVGYAIHCWNQDVEPRSEYLRATNCIQRVQHPAPCLNAVELHAPALKGTGPASPCGTAQTWWRKTMQRVHDDVRAVRLAGMGHTRTHPNNTRLLVLPSLALTARPLLLCAPGRW
jgi:hypothetical protein